MLDAATNTPVSSPQQAAQTAHNGQSAPSGCRQAHTWHVAATKPRSERIAHAALHHRGYAPYLPLTLGKPLFPGYLFLQLGIGQPWYPIAWCPGVYSLLSTAGKPSIVARGVISALQAGDEMRATPIPNSAQWAPGMPCSLRKGYAMEGVNAVVLDVRSSGAARIALMMLGQLREAYVTTNALQHREA